MSDRPSPNLLSSVFFLCSCIASFFFLVSRSLEPEFRLQMARSIILGKLHNSRVVLQRMNWKRSTERATGAIGELLTVMEKVRGVGTEVGV